MVEVRATPAGRKWGNRRLVATLTIHHGRHTFISHALAGGRTLAEVRDAAGHANVSITSAYQHVAVDDVGIGNFRGGLKGGKFSASGRSNRRSLDH